MAAVTVKFSTSARLSKVRLDGVRLRFTNGTSTKTLVDGRRHVLDWLVRGAPADTYSIEVTAPESVKRSLETNRALGEDKLGFGLYDFRL